METDKRLLSLQLNGKTCQYQGYIPKHIQTKTNVPIIKRFLNYDVKKGKNRLINRKVQYLKNAL